MNTPYFSQMFFEQIKKEVRCKLKFQPPCKCVIKVILYDNSFNINNTTHAIVNIYTLALHNFNIAMLYKFSNHDLKLASNFQYEYAFNKILVFEQLKLCVLGNELYVVNL